MAETVTGRVHVPVPLAVTRFGPGTFMKVGDSIVVKFVVDGQPDPDAVFQLDEAILIGFRETPRTPAERLSRITDSLADVARKLPANSDDCDPGRHIDRALRELKHALVVLNSRDG